jgi:hypothetical protein
MPLGEPYGEDRFKLADVESAPARALVLATEAGQWGLFEQIAHELSACARRRDNAAQGRATRRVGGRS